MNRRSLIKSIFVAPLAALLGTKIVHGMDDNRSAKIVSESKSKIVPRKRIPADATLRFHQPPNDLLKHLAKMRRAE